MKMSNQISEVYKRQIFFHFSNLKQQEKRGN